MRSCSLQRRPTLLIRGHSDLLSDGTRPPPSSASDKGRGLSRLRHREAAAAVTVQRKRRTEAAGLDFRPLPPPPRFAALGAQRRAPRARFQLPRGAAESRAWPESTARAECEGNDLLLECERPLPSLSSQSLLLQRGCIMLLERHVHIHTPTSYRESYSLCFKL
jgi:hypothetical protein